MHGFRCYDNIALNAKCQRVLVLTLCLVYIVSASVDQFISKVRTDSSTQFGSNPILIDWIRIESTAGSNPILIVQICTALDRTVDFNERAAFYNRQSVYAE